MMVLESVVVDDEFRRRVDVFRVPPSGVGLIEACAGNPVLFCERMLGVRPYAWQVPFLIAIRDRPSNVIAAMTSRQIGKSFVIAVAALWLAIFNKAPDKSMGNTRVAIVSRGDQQARKLLREIKMWMRFGDRFMARTYVGDDGEPLFGRSFFSDLLDPKGENNQRVITFRSGSDLQHPFLLAGSSVGSWIHSYPPTPIVLGETFTVGMLDEAAHPSIDNEFVVRELLPTGIANDALWVTTSTPWKASGWFYNVIHSDDVCRFVFDIEAIRDEELGRKQYEAAMREISKLRAEGDLTSVNIIYYCRFDQGDRNFFAPDKVRAVFDESLVMVDSCALPCDMGIDFGGKVSSRTVVTISRLREDGVIERLFCKVYPVGEDDGLLGDVAGLLTRFNVQRIIPDDCPQGDYLIREMVRRGWNVQPNGRGMSFRSDKVRKYSAFRSMVNRGLVRSFPDDLLFEEMMALEYSDGVSQSRIMPARGYTDDLIDSFVLSAYFFVGGDGVVVGFLDWDDV